MQIRKLLIKSFLQPRISFSLFGPNSFLCSLSSNIFSPCLSLNVTDRVSKPNKTKRANLWFCPLKFLHFQRANRNIGRCWTKWQQAVPEFKLLLISSCLQFSIVNVILKYLKFATFSMDLLVTFMLQSCPQIC